MRGRSVRVVGECQWRADPMDVSILGEIDRYKLPVLAQVSGLKVAPSVRILLFSRAGFTDGLVAAADRDRRVLLVRLDELLTVPSADQPSVL